MPSLFSYVGSNFGLSKVQSRLTRKRSRTRGRVALGVVCGRFEDKEDTSHDEEQG